MQTSDTIDRRTELAGKIWQGLSRSWLLGGAGGAVLLLFLCALFVQQMPGQLRDDPAEAARWLLVASEQYGPLGNVLRALGLFNVLHNPLLQLLLMLIALVLLMHLGNVIAATWRLRRIATALQLPVMQAGDPVGLPVVQPLYRLRQPVAGNGETVAAQLQTMLAARFVDLRHTALTVAPAAWVHRTHDDAPAAANAAATAMLPEIRLLARRDWRYALLRPFLLVGLFVALVAVWLILIAGWEITPPLLAPGEQYHGTKQDLTIRYDVTAVDEADTGQLHVQIGDATRLLPLDSTLRTNWWQLAIANHSGPPALFIQAEDEASLLSQPGQAQVLSHIGLVFPSVGSEESVVVDQSVVLRIVRLLGTSEQPGITAFWVEVYQVDADEPVLRLEIADRSREVLTVNDKSYTLNFLPLTSVVLNVHYQPGVWLLGVALLLVLIGSVGYGQRPAFVLVQVAPWPVDRTVIVVQSDLAVEIQALRDWLAQPQNAQNETL